MSSTAGGRSATRPSRGAPRTAATTAVGHSAQEWMPAKTIRRRFEHGEPIGHRHGPGLRGHDRPPTADGTAPTPHLTCTYLEEAARSALDSDHRGSCAGGPRRSHRRRPPRPAPPRTRSTRPPAGHDPGRQRQSAQPARRCPPSPLPSVRCAARAARAARHRARHSRTHQHTPRSSPAVSVSHGQAVLSGPAPHATQPVPSPTRRRARDRRPVVSEALPRLSPPRQSRPTCPATPPARRLLVPGPTRPAQPPLAGLGVSRAFRGRGRARRRWARETRHLTVIVAASDATRPNQKMSLMTDSASPNPHHPGSWATERPKRHRGTARACAAHPSTLRLLVADRLGLRDDHGDAVATAWWALVPTKCASLQQSETCCCSAPR